MAQRPIGEAVRRVAQQIAAADLNAVWGRVQQDPVDEAALRELVDRWGPGFLGYCRAVLRDAHTAEDVVSASFAVLIRYRGKPPTAEDALRYLWKTVARSARRARSRAARRPDRTPLDASTPPPDPHHSDPAEHAERAEIIADVSAALGQLSENERCAVVLVSFLGHTEEQAAAVMGCGRSTVSTYLGRAREKLGRLLVRWKDAVGAAGGVATVDAALTEAARAASLPTPTAALVESILRQAAAPVKPASGWMKAAAVLLLLGAAGGVTLMWPAPAPEPPPDLAAQPAPQEQVETLQAKNLRILHNDVLPLVIARLEQVLDMKVNLTATRAEGSEVYVAVEGTRPWLGGKNPPKFRARYDMLSRVLLVQADVGGTGEWRLVRRREQARFELFGKEYSFAIVIESLKLYETFALLPRDDRASAEFVHHRLTGKPYGGADLLVPHLSGELAGNRRYLYLSTWQHLLVRDKFTGWRRAGATEGTWLLAATESHLFGASNTEPARGWAHRQPGEWRLYVRPATAELADWTALDSMPPRFGDNSYLPSNDDTWVGIATAGGWVFAVSSPETLAARPATPKAETWRPAGKRPAGRGKLLGCGDRLYFLDIDGRLWDRPAVPFDAEWHLTSEVGRFVTATVWADRLVCWNRPPEGKEVLARTLGPPLGEWKSIGRVDPGDSFLGHKW